MIELVEGPMKEQLKQSVMEYRKLPRWMKDDNDKDHLEKIIDIQVYMDKDGEIFYDISGLDKTREELSDLLRKCAWKHYHESIYGNYEAERSEESNFNARKYKILTNLRKIINNRKWSLGEVIE